MKICFIDKTEFSFSYKDINKSKLRGAESIFINLSKEVSNLGHEVIVFNNCNEDEYESANYSWLNINRLKSKNYNFDVVISNSDCNFFKLVSAKKNILISHSNQSIEQFIRKNQLISFLKFRPIIWMTSNFQAKKRSTFIKMFGHILIPWSVDEMFLKTKIHNNINNNQAIFTSRPDRNLNILLDVWLKYINPYDKEKRLIIYGKDDKLLNKSIINKGFVSHDELIRDIGNSRLFLIPGHKAETFCLAAEEAKELCLPIVTMGIGCLSERVDHGKNGFVAKNENEFKDYILELFNNNELWNNFRNNLIQSRGRNNWRNVANTFIKQINE